MKLLAGKPAASEGKVIGMPKLKGDTAGPSFDPLQNEQIRPDAPSSKPVLPKNETPNRFWAFVEPYCAPIAQDDIKLLEDLIKGHSDMTEYYKVPKLGQHYTQRWAKEDLENERLRGAADANASIDGKGSEEAIQMLKKAEAANEESPFGELTQRLVAGLLEENAINQNDLEESTKKGSGGESSDTENAAAKCGLIKSLNITNAENLEARVRKELEEQGILDPNEDTKDGVENDEILEELVRCQNELKAVSTHNLSQLKRLLKAAKEEMARQEIRNKLQQADNEVMEAYRKISQARSKKKPPTKKEREQALRQSPLSSLDRDVAPIGSGSMQSSFRQHSGCLWPCQFLPQQQIQLRCDAGAGSGDSGICVQVWQCCIGGLAPLGLRGGCRRCQHSSRCQAHLPRHGTDVALAQYPAA